MRPFNWCNLVKKMQETAKSTVEDAVSRMSMKIIVRSVAVLFTNMYKRQSVPFENELNKAKLCS